MGNRVQIGRLEDARRTAVTIGVAEHVKPSFVCFVDEGIEHLENSAQLECGKEMINPRLSYLWRDIGGTKHRIQCHAFGDLVFYWVVGLLLVPVLLLLLLILPGHHCVEESPG